MKKEKNYYIKNKILIIKEIYKKKKEKIMYKNMYKLLQENMNSQEGDSQSK